MFRPTRRGFLSGLLGAGALPALSWAAAGSPGFLAAARDPDDSFALYGLRADGGIAFRVPLPARGHAGAGHPTRPLAVAFARRPGTYALVLDCAGGEVLHRLSPPEDRQFNGHGVFLHGGEILATSEQRASDSAGRVGLWETRGWRRIGEIDGQGLGPHDLRLMPDGKTLVMANGGIATDATDRTKLNIPDMAPSLVWIDPDHGVIEGVDLPGLHQASIRHLALRPDGLVAFAMQWEGDPSRQVPLLGLVRQGEDPVLAEAVEGMRGYAGSVAFAGDGASVTITSPKGSLAQSFDARGRWLASTPQADVCGAATLGAAVMTSDGGGGLMRLAGGELSPLAAHPVAWDNHIVTLQG